LRSIEVARRDSRALFLDFKLHDIPNTVRGAVTAAREQGADFLTLHVSGGQSMMAAARDAADGKIRLLGVTVLTHMDRETLMALDLPGDSSLRVKRWAALANQSGCAGVVCSPLEAAVLRAENPSPFLLVTPGIRRASIDGDDQRRTATPSEALRSGADILVIGRPITGSPDPARALDEIAAEITSI
jgi:orotidine-5'-phosphate decarboxylase